MTKVKVILAGIGALTVGCGSKTADQQPKVPSDPVEIRTEPIETTDGGFYMDFARTIEGQTSSALKASYAWSGKKGEVNAVNAGGSWRVAFPDKPKPDEVSTLELAYTFPLSEDDKKVIREKFRTAAQAYVEAAVAASEKLPDGEAFGNSPLSSSPLRRYWRS